MHNVQLNKYAIEPYFLQNFQSNTTVCLIIPMFCKSCEPKIVLPVLKIKTKTITKSVNNQTNCRIAVEILKKIWICLVFIQLYIFYLVLWSSKVWAFFIRHEPASQRHCIRTHCLMNILCTNATHQARSSKNVKKPQT